MCREKSHDDQASCMPAYDAIHPRILFVHTPEMQPIPQPTYAIQMHPVTYHGNCVH